MSRPSVAPDRVGVIFVNFHSEALIAQRAATLLRAGHHVVIADNSSTYRGPGHILDMGSNEGFARACNRAAAVLDASISVMCLHNPDVDAPEAAVGELAAALQKQTRPGIAAPAEQTGHLLRLRGYHYPGLLREAAFAALPYGFADRGRIQASASRPPGMDGRTVTFRGRGKRFASGSLVVVDRKAWTAVGGLDERYFLYCEDLDLWHRLGLRGYTCEFYPDIVMRHHFAASSTETSLTRRSLCRWLSVELFLETFQPAQWRLMRAVHQRLLWRHRRSCPGLTAEVRKLWSQGKHPAEVMSAMFDRLADETFP